MVESLQKYEPKRAIADLVALRPGYALFAFTDNQDPKDLARQRISFMTSENKLKYIIPSRYWQSDALVAISPSVRPILVSDKSSKIPNIFC